MKQQRDQEKIKPEPRPNNVNNERGMQNVVIKQEEENLQNVEIKQEQQMVEIKQEV